MEKKEEIVEKKQRVLKFKRLYEEAVSPTKATEGAACFDLTVHSHVYDEVTTQHHYGFGVAVEIPEGYVGLLFQRSSVYKTNLIMSNCVGIIDSDYRGEIKAKFRRDTTSIGKPYEVGERAAQLMIIRTPDFVLEEVDELNSTIRGDGGYGSTGK